MSFCRRSTAVRWMVVVLVLVANLPGGRTQTRTRKPTVRPCTITLDEVDSLVDLLGDIIHQQPTDDQQDVFDDSEDEAEGGAQPSTQCSRELDRLRRSILGLQQRYHKLKDSSTTIREYEIRKNRFELQRRDLQTKLTGLESRMSSSQRSQLGKLKRKIKDVERELNSSVTQLEQQRNANAKTFADLVVNKINRNRNATMDFQTLMSYSTDPYSAIVQGVDSDRSMMRFLANVDFRHQPIAGYEALVDRMIARGTLHGDVATDLLKHIQSIILVRDGAQHPRALALLKKFKKNAY